MPAYFFNKGFVLLFVQFYQPVINARFIAVIMPMVPNENPVIFRLF
jgi:hypothetical protein